MKMSCYINLIYYLVQFFTNELIVLKLMCQSCDIKGIDYHGTMLLMVFDTFYKWVGFMNMDDFGGFILLINIDRRMWFEN